MSWYFKCLEVSSCLATSALYDVKRFNVLKGLSEDVIPNVRTTNTMAKRTNDDLHNSSIKLNIEQKEPHMKLGLTTVLHNGEIGVNRNAPEW